jgi:hypothetical protein
MHACPVEINQLDLAIEGHHDILMTEITKDIVGCVEMIHSYSDVPDEGCWDFFFRTAADSPLIHSMTTI